MDYVSPKFDMGGIRSKGENASPEGAVGVHHGGALEVSVMMFVLRKSRKLSWPVMVFYQARVFYLRRIMQSFLLLSKIKSTEAAVVHCKERVNSLTGVLPPEGWILEESAERPFIFLVLDILHDSSLIKSRCYFID